MNSKKEQQRRLSTDCDDEHELPATASKPRSHSHTKRRRKNTNQDESDPFEEPSPLIVNLNESNRPHSDDSDSDSVALATAFELHKTKKINGQSRSKDNIILSEFRARLSEELHQQELRHRDEIHALRKTQMEELYKLKLEHARLETVIAHKNGRRSDKEVA